MKYLYTGPFLEVCSLCVHIGDRWLGRPKISTAAIQKIKFVIRMVYCSLCCLYLVVTDSAKITFETIYFFDKCKYATTFFLFALSLEYFEKNVTASISHQRVACNGIARPKR